MESATDREIREHLTLYLRGRLTLAEFHRWLLPLLWKIDRQSEADAFRRASRIVLYISEYSAGQHTEGELRDLLEPHILPHPAATP